MAKDLLSEAIADAKAVREVALENAKLALSEAFDSKLKSMFSAKLAEELEEESFDDFEDDMDLDMDGLEDLPSDEEELDALSGMDPGNDMNDDLMDDESMDIENDYFDIGDIDDLEEEIDLDELMNEINSLYEEEDEDEVSEGEEEDEDSMDEIDINAILAELEKDLEDDMSEGDYGNDEELEEARRKVKKADDDKKKAMADKKKAEDQLQEAYTTIYTLKDTISEMNLLNSKLLYCNKIFKDNVLTQDQKVKVVESLDEASTPKEAKLVYNTIVESFKIGKVKTRSIQESLGFASKSTNAKKVIVEQVDETVARMQRLANIKP